MRRGGEWREDGGWNERSSVWVLRKREYFVLVGRYEAATEEFCFMKSIRILAAAGLVAAFGASQALAFSGDLIKCNPSAGTGLTVGFSGLSCVASKNKVSIKSDAETQALNGCVANADAPWDAWVDGGWSKTSETDALTITKAVVNLKGQTFGSCNFSGSDVTSGASGGGSVSFLNSSNGKVKGASLKFFGKVAGDVATYQATAIGLITKGLGIGGDISVGIGLDLANPVNSPILACNTGANCVDPNDPSDAINVTPIKALAIITTAASELKVSLGTDDPNDPNDYSALP